MFSFLWELFSTDFMPHIMCLRTPTLAAVHALSDGLIAISYFLIPIGLVQLVRRRKDLSFHWMFFLFAAFILSCGITHVMGIVTLWVPVYRFEALVKIITALASAATAILLFRLIPFIARMPSVEQWQTEIGLRKEAEAGASLLASIVACSDDAIISKTLEGIITSWNGSAERMFGYTAQEAIGKNISLIIPSDKLEEDVLVLERLQAGKAAEHFETTRCGKNGNLVQVSLNVSLVRDSKGNIMGASEIAREIGERIRSQEKILRAQAKFQRVVESAPNAMVMINREGLITLINAQTEKLFGYSSEELMGQPVEVLVPQRFRSQHQGHRGRFFASPAALSPSVQAMGEGRELYALRKDNSEFPIEVGLNPIQTEEGLMVLSAITDVTERKLAEATRLHAEAKFRSLLEAAPDAMVVVNQTGGIVLVNNQAERLFGYGRQEMLGSSIVKLVPEYYERNAPPLSAGSTGARVMMLGAMEDLFARRKDGSEFPVEISLSPLSTEEGLLVSSAIRDVTARKRAAEQIMILNRQLERAASDAESANRAKSIFLSTMSHEIRTPLNAILGYAQLMSRDESMGPAAIANLKIIGRSGEHLLMLINDVLDMSKIEAGRLEINRATFSLSRLLEDLAAMFRLRAASKALQFAMSTSGDTVDYVIADEGKIRQMLINLLGNAIKFTQRGEIMLEVNLQQRGDGCPWLSVRVSDTGPGISEEEQKLLFEPFSQSAARLNIEEGTGLGLVISRRYARLMGGDITMVSTVGKGSTFLLEIPIERGDGAVVVRHLPERRVSGIQGGKDRVKILVVDDRLENRDWLMQLLSSLGCEVRGAVNGADAIKDWEEWNPQMILMDVHMPVMDGLEATRRIKADPRGKDTQIVVLTASAMDDDRRKVSSSGADGFLAKPCSENQLLEKMAALLDLTLVYADNPPEDQQMVADAAALSAERLIRLPLHLLEELRDATMSGDKKMLNRLIQEVRDLENSNSMQALANALSDLADKYQYDALMRVLEDACQR